MKKSTVLVVDDTPANIDMISAALGDEYHIKVALNGEKAIKIAKANPPDIILLDIMMPGMDGYEVCSHLKADPATSHIPVIFVTALGTDDDEEKGLNLGAIDYLVKPISPPIVRARVRNHIQLKLKSDLLESLAMLDSVTNIPNRRRYTETLDTEWRRAFRIENPISIIIIDIDHFKQFNDYYGHGAGDECLRKVATCLCYETNLRPTDLVARYGGEEFIALLSETDIHGAKLLAERFRQNVEALQIPHEKSSCSAWVTTSVGYATAIPASEIAAQQLMEEADRYLYVAKAAGRNRIQGP